MELGTGTCQSCHTTYNADGRVGEITGSYGQDSSRWLCRLNTCCDDCADALETRVALEAGETPLWDLLRLNVTEPPAE